MRKIRWSSWIIITALSANPLDASVWAQQPAPARPAPARDADQPAGRAAGQADPATGTGAGQSNSGLRGTQQGNPADAHVADCLLLGNQEEVTLARFALERAQSDKTKEFAQQMINDHSKIITELEKFATHSGSQIELDRRTAGGAEGTSGAGARPGGETTRGQGGTNQGQTAPGSAASQPGTSSPAAGTGAASGQGATNPSGVNSGSTPTTRGTPATATTEFRGAMAPSPEQLFAMDLREKQECVALTKQDLEKEEGKHFDMAYVSLQVAMHTQMLAKLRAAESSVSEEFRPVIQKGLQTTMEHKDHAVHLKAELKGNSDQNRTNDRPSK